MIQKFFLALDYAKDEEVVETGDNALDFLEREFGEELNGRLGVKLNQDVLTGCIHPRFRDFAEDGYDVFADMKISHGSDTGERIIERIVDGKYGDLPIRYVTVSAGLGSKIMREYVASARERDIDIIAFTAHTKIPEEEVGRIYAGDGLDGAIYNLGQAAYQGGCHAIVLEAERLRNPKISGLPLKKLVTGIRIDPADKGSQSRVTTLDNLQELRDRVDYVVVSSRYLKDNAKLSQYISALL